MFVKSGKINIIIDGQFGSTGKGLASSFVGSMEHVDIAISDSSPNAGHSFYIGDELKIVRHLPVSGVLQDRSTIYLCAGSIIDPKVLRREIEEFGVEDRVIIHPRAAVVEDIDIRRECDENSGVTKIASTQKGTGSALSRKIMRESKLAEGDPYLRQFVKHIDVEEYLKIGCTVLMEVPQGFGLSINSGYSYPHCTSREITVSQAMSDVPIHPRYLGNVMMIIRTFPIRVGHIYKNGKKIGDSGPFYSDSEELSWKKDLKIDPEITTVTKRPRRIASFSMQQFKKSCEKLKPTHVFLNFANYLDTEDLIVLLKKLGRKVKYIGYGAKIEDVWSSFCVT